MGKERRERKQAQRAGDVARRAAVLRQSVASLTTALTRTESRLRVLRAEAPADAPCCPSCWLTACRPEYNDLVEKAERQEAELLRLKAKLATLRPMPPAP